MNEEKSKLDFNPSGRDKPEKFDVKGFKDRARGSIKSIFTHMFPQGKMR